MAVLDRVPVDDIAAEAREVQAGRFLLTLVALIPFLLGWLAGKLVNALAFVGLAVKAGWLEARKPTPRDGG
jgi:hypothetical protein